MQFSLFIQCLAILYEQVTELSLAAAAATAVGYPSPRCAANRCVQASADKWFVAYASLAASVTDSWSHLWSL